MAERLRILAIDVGTSRVKAGLVGADGRVTAVRTAPRARGPRATLGTVIAFLRSFAPLGYDAVALTAYMAHAFLLDGEGGVIGATDAPARPADAAALDPDGDLGRRTGYGPEHVSLRSWWWVARSRGEPLLARVRTILPVKDALLAALGAPIGTDPASAGSLGLWDIGADDWDHPLLDRLGIAPSLLPPVEAPTARAGALRPELGLPGPIPLVRGSGDGLAGSYGVSDLSAGTRYVNLGTHGVYRTAAERVPEDARFAYPTGLGGVLAGLNVPNLGRQLRALGDGTPEHARLETLLAPLVRWHWAHAAGSAERPGHADAVWLMGGGSATEGLAQILADALGSTVLLAEGEPTLVGAARLAAGASVPTAPLARRVMPASARGGREWAEAPERSG
jgi:sugar (pentulose or hexulose) kinase